MNLEIRATGSSFISGRNENNPRDLVVDLVKKNPKQHRKDMFENFRAMLQDNDDYQRAVDFYFFVNMYDQIVRVRDSHHRAPAIASMAAKEQEEIRKAVDIIKGQIVLLDLTMPNGKPMKACTGAEMAKFGNRYQKIADQVGKNKFVGSVLSEDQVKKILA